MAELEQALLAWGVWADSVRKLAEQRTGVSVADGFAVLDDPEYARALRLGTWFDEAVAAATGPREQRTPPSHTSPVAPRPCNSSRTGSPLPPCWTRRPASISRSLPRPMPGPLRRLVVATVDADYVDCQFAQVTVGAQTIWPLDQNTSSGQSIQQQVLAISGVRWPYPPG